MAGDEFREPMVLGAENPEDAEVLRRLLSRPKRKPPPPLKMNMTPMIDIVFQLIIFFMIVSEFQNMEMEQITLPFALEAKEESKEGQQNRIVVNVNDKGEIRMMRRQYSSEQLKALLIERARNSPKDADGLPTIAVKLRADAECEYKYVQDVIVQCMRAYIWKLSFGASHIDREELMLY